MGSSSLQSCGQETGVSNDWQRELPQPRQSNSQRSLSSQTPLHSSPQSAEHEAELSEALHTPSPQPAVVRQSAGQVAAVSSLSQSPSPQPAKQSVGQVGVFSPTLHTASPQKQSSAHWVGFSLGEAQIWSPHSGGEMGLSPTGARPHARS